MTAGAGAHDAAGASPGAGAEAAGAAHPAEDAPEEDRRGRDLPLDSHLHTVLSPDSDVDINSFAAQAVELGIAEIAITDHVDFEPGAPAYGYTSFQDRETIVRTAADRWGPQGLTIRFGVEITYFATWEQEIREHLARHSYDYVIGSVHHRVGSVYKPATIGAWVAGRSVAEVVEPWFSEVEASARSGLFDTLGHIDMVKRFVHPHVLPSALADRADLYEPILRALVDSGTALEVNTSGLRHPVGETYPAPWVVELYRSMGGERVTVGSDAHRSWHFAWALGDGYEIAGAAGLRPPTHARRRED